MVKEGSGRTLPSLPPADQVKKVGRNVESGISMLCRGMNILGIGVLLCMTALTVVDVIGRLFKRPIVGGTEITEFMMVTIVFLCIGWAATRGKMITVDLITMKLSPKVQNILNVITMFIGLVVVIIITWRSYLSTLDVQGDNVTSMILHIPSAPFMWILSIGFSVLCLVMILLFVRYFIKAVSK
jgi:TRAP-type transport system small permease protein